MDDGEEGFDGGDGEGVFEAEVVLEVGGDDICLTMAMAMTATATAGGVGVVGGFGFDSGEVTFEVSYDGTFVG